MFQQIANFPSPPILTSLSPTVANCANTATETAIITFVVPPNTWDNGKSIAVNGYFETKNNSGGSIAITVKAKLNSSSVTLVNATSVSDNATMGKSFRGFTLRRINNDVVIASGSSTGGDFMPNTTAMSGGYSTNQFSTNIYTSVDFTTTITVTLTAQWASAGDATTFFNCIFADAFKY